jgi:hypothetical protein
MVTPRKTQIVRRMLRVEKTLVDLAHYDGIRTKPSVQLLRRGSLPVVPNLAARYPSSTNRGLHRVVGRLQGA